MAGIPDREVCKKDWFTFVFKADPRLADITIASGKENFGRCSTCSTFDVEIKVAQKAGDAKVLVLKQGRRDRLLLERADKLSYYYFRCKAR
eukprot:2187305-Pleurochrysis_carterae.AAC.1